MNAFTIQRIRGILTALILFSALFILLTNTRTADGPGDNTTTQVVSMPVFRSIQH